MEENMLPIVLPIFDLTNNWTYNNKMVLNGFNEYIIKRLCKEPKARIREVFIRETERYYVNKINENFALFGKYKDEFYSLKEFINEKTLDNLWTKIVGKTYYLDISSKFA